MSHGKEAFLPQNPQKKGEIARNRRIDLDVTVKQVAHAARIAQSTLSNFENERQPLSPLLEHRLEWALGIAFSDESLNPREEELKLLRKKESELLESIARDTERLKYIRSEIRSVSKKLANGE